MGGRELIPSEKIARVVGMALPSIKYHGNAKIL